MDKTPAIKQWEHFKAKYPDVLILMKMGDFYEGFDTDAVILNKVIGLTITHRSGLKMAGLPYHSIDPYLKRLIEAGHKVALVEPVGENADKTPKRDAVRMTSSGITVAPN